MATVIRGDDNFDTAINGKVLQVGHVQVGTVATGTTPMPFDGSIPQITEGDEFMSLSFTPKNASNILLIESSASVSTTTNDYAGFALFKDAVTNALSSKVSFVSPTHAIMPLMLQHRMVAGTTSAITFRIRVGAQVANTTTFNGRVGGLVGGSVLSSYITVTEYTP